MPQAIAAAAAATANFVSGAVYSGLTAIGVSASTAAVISTYAASITAVTVATLAQVGPALLFRPNVPTPEFGRSVKRQPIPDRVSGYGRARVGGAYMLYETDGTNEGLALNVFAMHDGLIAGWGDIYLNDQTVTVGLDTYVESGPDLRYGKFGDLVRIETRLGEPTETNYSAVNLARPDVWPTDARGDGIASLMMIAKGKSKENFARDYPNGLPLPSAVGDLQYCWDPRLGARGTIVDDADKAASATWVGGSQNPILQLLDYMTNAETGMGLSVSRFLPNIDAWEAAADVCDEAVPLAAGGTVPRYQSGGLYLHATAPADVIATILATCDGWMAQDANGCFTVQAGSYVEPTVTIGEEHIVSLSRQFYREDERATNEIVVSYTDPTFDYTEVQTTPWRREADILARGHVRSQPLALPWVQNNSQARRLAKIAAYKATAPISGTLTTTLDGLRAWSERRIRIQAPSDGAAMADIVVDLLPLTLNADNTVSIPFVSSEPDAYDWTTAEETAGAGDDTRPGDTAPETPVIDDVQPFDVTASSARLRIYIEDATAGLTYLARWRVTGETAWTNDAQQTTQAATPHGFIETGLVFADSLDVQVALITAGGFQSEWSATFAVDAGFVNLIASLPFPDGPFRVGVASANQIAGLEGWSYARTGAAMASNADGSVETFAADVERITDQGLLIEAAATNRLLRSQEFDNASWVKQNATVTANAVVAPDGTTTADTLVASVAGGASVQHRLDQTPVTTAGSQTISVYAKPAGYDYITLRIGTAGGGFAFNVATGAVVGSEAGVTASIVAASNGFYRCVLTVASAGANAIGRINTSPTTNTTFVGDGVSGAHLWQADLVDGSSPVISSPILTTTAVATRGADTATLALPAGSSSDPIQVIYSSGTANTTRGALANPLLLDLGAASGGAWVQTYIETVTVAPG
jgi:hypothetical protein